MKKSLIIGGIIAVAAGLVVWGIIAGNKKPAVASVKAVVGDISSDIMITGTTKPTQSVDLSFERTGKVSAVHVAVGDKVRAGQTLVELENADILAQLSEAQAVVAAAQARLNQLKRGTRPEEVAIQEVTVANAQITLNRSQQALFDSLNDAYVKADDAARTKTDANFTNPRSSDPKLNFQSVNPQYTIDLPTKKYAVERSLVDWKSSLDALAVGSGLISAADDAQTRLAAIKDYLDVLAAALNYVNPGTVSPASAEAWKSDAALARTEIGAAINGLSASQTSLRAAQSSLNLTQKNLDLAKAGSTPEDIAAQEAVVAQYQASLRGIQVALSKTILKSPIDGTVTVQGAKLGQIVTVTTASVANSSLISIISEKKMEVDAFAPEVNVGRLAVGQAVNVVFDALQGEKFSGSIMEIDPAETVIDGVVNYKIKVALGSDDSRIKSGLTANLSVQTAVKKGVILLPQNAILQNDQGTFVRKIEGKASVEVPVKLGIRGSDGMVEVISGVKEGDMVENVGAKS